MIEEIETARVYGRQAAASLAAIKAIDFSDPLQTYSMVSEQAVNVAEAMGFEMKDAGAYAGIAGAAITALTSRLQAWTESKKNDADAVRDAAQKKIVAALGAKYIAGAWVMELATGDLPGDDGYYKNVGGTGVPGVLRGEKGPALPLDKTSGCYRQGDPAGKPAKGGGVWRMWPGLFPLVFNTSQLTFATTAFQGRDAIELLTELMRRPFDAVGNLRIDGRDVALTLSTLIDWAKPLFEDDIFSKAPITPVGPHMTIETGNPSTGEPGGQNTRNTYVHPNGLLEVFGLQSRHKPGAADYTPYVRWIQTPAGVRSMEPAAYNFVIQTCARFFTYREQLLSAPWTWTPAQRKAAALSSESSVLAALKRKAPTTVGRTTTTTTAGAKPAAVAKEKPRPTRVGRAATPTRVGRLPLWPTIAEIEDSIKGTEAP